MVFIKLGFLGGSLCTTVHSPKYVVLLFSPKYHELSDLKKSVCAVQPPSLWALVMERGINSHTVCQNIEWKIKRKKATCPSGSS